MFNKKPLYSIKDRINNDLAKNKGDKNILWLMLFAVVLVILGGYKSDVPMVVQAAQAAYVPSVTMEMQELHVVPVVEDYSTSLNDYPYAFGNGPLSDLNNNRWQLPQKTFFTSYNPERGQTDDSPCIGAGLTNVCELAKDGVRVIALSQDMVGRAAWKEYHYGQKVMLYSDNPQCQGVFEIHDTMNKRYTNRGDLFQLTRATNTSCYVTVTRI